MKFMTINENPRDTMEVLRGQEASLESSKGFYRGSMSYLTDASTHVPKSIKIYKNIKINEIHEIHENPKKNPMEVLRRQSQPGIEQRFL